MAFSLKIQPVNQITAGRGESNYIVVIKLRVSP